MASTIDDLFSIEIIETRVKLNGEYVERSLSDDSDAITFPDSLPLYSITRGAFGSMHVSRMVDRGGEVTLKMMPHMPATGMLMTQVERILYGEGGEGDDIIPVRIIWDMDVEINTGGLVNDDDVIIECRKGVLRDGPLGFTLGKGETSNMNFMFEFESIRPRFVNFAGLPDSFEPDTWADMRHTATSNTRTLPVPPGF